MASSRTRVEIHQSGENFQLRVGGASARELKLLKTRLIIDPAKDALLRMDSYSDLRNDEYFKSPAGEICFTIPRGRMPLLAELVREKGFSVTAGEEHLPNPEEVKRALERDASFGDEISRIATGNLPFYKRGPKALVLGILVRMGILVLILVIARVASLSSSDHFTVRSFPSILKTLEEPYQAQSYPSYFMNPTYTHRSLLKIKRPLYIRGNKMMLEGGFFIQIEGVQNLKASIEAHQNAPVTIRIDGRSGEMKIASVHVGDDMVTHKGRVTLLNRMPLSPHPLRVDATSQRPGYKKVTDADPRNEESFIWMLGQKVSLICRVESEGDRYLASCADGEFKFAMPKADIKPEIVEILNMTVASGERAILDLRLEVQAYPMRSRRNPRQQRHDTNIITEADLHYAQVQGAVMKNF